MTPPLFANHSVFGWLLHLFAAIIVWHLVGRFVYAHPVLALLVGGAVLLAIVLLRLQRRASP